MKKAPSSEPKRRAGRPVVFGGKRVQVYLDAVSVETAAKLGDGNVSDGIRKALKLVSVTEQQ